MVFIEHNYKGNKVKVKILLRQRLKLKEKLIYCNNKIQKYENVEEEISLKLLPEIEEQIDKMLAQGI